MRSHDVSPSVSLGMALCEQCGSINIVRVQSELADKFAACFSSKRPFACRRCGWRGRRDWSDENLRELMNYGAGGAEPDPSLTVLDREPQAAARTGARSVLPRKLRKNTTQSGEVFDLAAIDLATGETSQPHAPVTPDLTAGRPRHVRRRRLRDRQKRSRRREIIAGIAATALVMLFVVLFGLTGSCSGGTDLL